MEGKMLKTKIDIENLEAGVNTVSTEKTRLHTVLDAKRPEKEPPKTDWARLGIYMIIFLLAAAVAVVFNINKISYDNQIADLTDELIVVSNSRRSLQESLKDAIQRNKEYQFSIWKEMEEKKALHNVIASLKTTEMQRESRIAKLQSDLNTVANENVVLRQDTGELKKQLIFSRNIQENLQMKIKRLLTRTKVDLGNMVVNPSALNGRVLKANEKHNFVIVDLGKNDGLKKGAALMAYRDDEPIGELQVEKVYDELAVGKPVFDWKPGELKVGDTIVGKD